MNHLKTIIEVAAAMLILSACTGCTHPNDSADPGSQNYEATWYRDVEPIIYDKCATCHQQGGVGAGNWTDYETAAEWAIVIQYMTETLQMPPPAADPECRTYAGHERMQLSEDEISTLGTWAEDDAPLGDLADQTPDLEIPSFSLDDYDLRIEMPESHTLELDSEGNQYFCFVLENPVETTQYITAIDVDVGNPAVVHHMVLAVDLGGNAGIEYGTNGTTPSFECSNPIIESDWLLVHAWTPGMEPVYFPEGVGLALEPGQQMVLQMHYFGNPDEVLEDQSAYLMQTTDTVERSVSMSVMGPAGFSIPPDDAEYTATHRVDNTSTTDIEVLGAFPHMHLLGSYYWSWVENANEEVERCVVEGAYDFYHQMTYMFDEPALVAAGESLHFTCMWDNSEDNPDQFFEPPQTITYGEGTTDEMCFLLYYAVAAE